MTIHYDGHPSFTTTLGSLCTIVHTLICAVVTFVAVKRLLLNENPIISSYLKHHEFDSHEAIFNPFEIGLDLYFGLSGSNFTGTNIDPRFGQFDVYYITNHSTKVKIDFGPCSDPKYTPRFETASRGNPDAVEFYRKQIEHLYCILEED